MMIWFIRKWLRKQIAQGNIEEVMYELVQASKEVWYEDNARTVNDHLKNEVGNAVAYVYQVLHP